MPLGGRVRVALSTPQLLTVEVTPPSVTDLSLHEGAEVIASFKATATRLADR